MQRRRMFPALIAAVLAGCGASPAFADEVHNPRFGFGMDVGVPSGATLAFVVHPRVDYVSLSAGLTYNALNFGGRLSLKVDPLGYFPGNPIGIFADVQGGFAAQGTVPGHSDLPSFGYEYVNTYLGLRLGRSTGFHWNIEAGPTYLAGTTANFQSVIKDTKGLTVGDPSLHGWLVPTLVTGFEVTW